MLEALNHLVIEHQIPQKHPVVLTPSQKRQLLYEASLIDIYRIEGILKQLLVLVEVVSFALGKGLDGCFAEF